MAVLIPEAEFVSQHKKAEKEGLSQTELSARLGFVTSRAVEKRRQSINKRRGYTVLKKLPSKRGKSSRKQRAVAKGAGVCESSPAVAPVRPVEPAGGTVWYREACELLAREKQRVLDLGVSDAAEVSATSPVADASEAFEIVVCR